MNPVIFESLPEVFSFVVVVLLLETCALLLATGRTYLKQGSFVAAGIAGAAVGEKVALMSIPGLAWPAIAGGLAAGLLLCYVARPVAVGMSLAYLAFFSSTYLVSVEYAQYVAAMVLFTYGLLLTDIAPTFVSSLLASGILVLTGIWIGVPVNLLLIVVFALAGARVFLTLRPHKPIRARASFGVRS